MNHTRSDDRAARRRVLVVAPFVPAVVASHGASAAIGGTLSALVEHHDVSLVYLRGPEEPDLDEKLAAELEIVREVRRPEPREGIARKWSLLFGLLRGRPMWTQQWWSPALAAELVKIVELWQPDVVHVELSVMAPYVHILENLKPKVVLTVYDPAVPAAMIELGRQRGALWLLHLLDVWAWRHSERAAARSADQLVVFTAADAHTLARSAGSTPISVVPFGTRIPDRSLPARTPDHATALFVGNARHPPNVEAVQRLCSEVLPRLVARVPEAQLVIVGHYPTVRVADELRDHVTMLGRVADVSAVLQRAAVVVAPIRLGGGMRVKVVEALAAGKAVVATSKALAGMSAAQEGAAICADDDSEFAAAVAGLMVDDEKRARLGERARAWAEANLTWSNSLQKYDELYSRLVHDDVIGISSPTRGSDPDPAIMSRDLLRRLDWRFLLPAPSNAMFEQLVIVGDDQVALAAETIGLAIDVHASLDGVRGADAVAVLAGARPDPEMVANALRPGGVVYWEVDRTRLASVAVSPARLAGRLAASGMTVEGAYALRPHPSRSEMFLPLYEPAALRWFLDDVYVTSTRWQVLGERVVRMLTRRSRHRLAQFAPYHATIATVPPRTGLTVAERAGGVIPAIRLGSTAMLTDSGNRAVLLCFPRGGAATAVIKVPKLPTFTNRTITEQHVTAAIRKAMGRDCEAIPRPLGTIDVAPGVTAGVEAAASGTSMKRTSARWRATWAAQSADLAAATDWITRLHRDHQIAGGAWDIARRAEVLDQQLDRFAERFGLTAEDRNLFDLTRHAGDSLLGGNFPVVWQHRDYSISNLLRLVDTVHVLDWEGGRPGIPLADLLRFVTSWHEAVRSLRTTEQRRGGLLDLFGSDEGAGTDATRAGRAALRHYADGVGIDVGFVPVLQVANWVELSLRRFDQQLDAGTLSTRTSHAQNRADNVEIGYVAHLASMRSSLFPEIEL
jgi:glycosyltransferase involved in cell wall biosynthesis